MAAKKTVPLEITLPPNTPEFMAPAYYSCLMWAIGFDPVLEHFKADTGRSIPKSPSLFEQMVDDACGHNPQEEFLRIFVPWFNEWVWGNEPLDNPGGK